MNKIKNLITAALLIMCLVSLSVSAAEAFIKNETPFLPAITDEKKDEGLDKEPTESTPEPPENPEGEGEDIGETDKEPTESTPEPPENPEGEGENTGETDKESTDKTETPNEQEKNEPSTDFVGGGGGGSASPSIKPTEEKKQAQTEEKQEEVQTENNIRTFSDIKKDDWFYSDVMFVFNNKIMTGTGDSEFSPDTTLNRAMMITILHRIDGDNSTYEKNFFNDVEKNSWYEKAVNWGYENKIVTGTSESTFAPMDNLTREQLCVMIYNYTKHVGVQTEFADISSYSDNNTVSDWAKEAVSWAVKEKIVTGKGNNTLAPGDSATRAEAAAIIRRYTEKFVEIERK